MKELSKELGVTPNWGKRNAVLYEISTYGSFAAKTLANRLTSKEFHCAVKDFAQRAEAELGSYYMAKDANGNEGIIRHIIWSDIIICPECEKELSYFENGTNRNPVQFKKAITCPCCRKTHNVDEFKPAIESVYDSLLKKEIVRKKRQPAWIYGTTNRNLSRCLAYEY